MRTRINYKQDDWESLLSVIMFVVNNQIKVLLHNKTPIGIEMAITPIVPADLISRATLSKAVNTGRLRGLLSRPVATLPFVVDGFFALRRRRFLRQEGVFLLQGGDFQRPWKRCSMVAKCVLEVEIAIGKLPSKSMINTSRSQVLQL